MIYHLNIGQPDVKTPEAFYEAIRDFKAETLEYAPAPGLPAHIEAVQAYYAKLGVKLDKDDILATSGGGEALEFILACILDEGDELLVPEPYYANYNTFAYMTRRQNSSHPHLRRKRLSITRSAPSLSRTSTPTPGVF